MDGMDDARAHAGAVAGEGALGVLEAIAGAVREGFDAAQAAAGAMRTVSAGLGPAARKPLGDLLAAGQARDAFDQRISHVTAAEARLGQLGGAERSAVCLVVAAQLTALSTSVCDAAGAMRAAFDRLLIVAEEHGHTVSVAPAVAAGQAGIVAMLAAAEGLADAGAVRSRSVPASARIKAAEADLAWLMALYTMDAERDVHRRAMAEAGDAPSSDVKG